MNSILYRIAAAALILGGTVPAGAASLIDSVSLSDASAFMVPTVSGSYNGLNYTASSAIVGTTSTATFAGGGDPRYFATAAQYRGSVALVIQEAGGSSICSGSLMADRMSILTAAHCVSGGANTATPIRTTAYFYGGSDPEQGLNQPGSTAITVSNYFVNAAYTGQVVDQNDIAVLRLSKAAPLFANSYDLYTGNASGKDFNVVGVGSRSDTGGSVGNNLASGRRRQGDNKYDFAIGDTGLNGGLNFLSRQGAQVANVLLADFDNGRSTNDASCIVARAVNVRSDRYCDLGRGPSEAMIAPGDSGGGSFIDGKIASVTSFRVSFGTAYGDIDGNLNSSFGEFAGYVSTAYHANWINSVLAPIPEPGTWALMLTGFAMTGIALRRRRAVRVTFA